MRATYRTVVTDILSATFLVVSERFSVTTTLKWWRKF